MADNVLYYGDNLDILRHRISPASVDWSTSSFHHTPFISSRRCACSRCRSLRLLTCGARVRSWARTQTLTRTVWTTTSCRAPVQR
jgi:hypothetical protein